MPELPEVEVTRLSFAERILGATVQSVRLGAPLRWPLGCEPDALVGLTVGEVRRRAKYLWMPLGATGGGLLMHLGMSGSLAFGAAGLPGKHDHFDLQTSHGLLRLTDPRRFGAVLWSPAFDAHPAAGLLASLGHEPFDPLLTPERFHAALARKRVAVKTALLSGDIVVGAGNIYACEALFAAAIHPRTRCDRLSRPRAARLLAALRGTLARALELGGSTLRDFRAADGMNGAFQLHAQVYGRAGQPCRRCGRAVKRVVMGQRATFFCAGCQKR